MPSSFPNDMWVATNIYEMNNVQPRNVTSASTLSEEQINQVYGQMVYVSSSQASEEQLKELKRQQSERVKARKELEKTTLKDFFETGLPINLIAFTNKREMLHVQSNYSFSRTSSLFFIIGKKLITIKERTTHLTAILKKLAEREGLEIVYVKLNDCPNYRFNIAVAYWNFNVGQIDDSKLMTKAKLRTNLDEHDDEDYGCECCDEDEDYPDRDELDDLPF